MTIHTYQSNGELAKHMIPVASWDPVEFHGQYCLMKPYSAKCFTFQPRTYIMGEGTGTMSDSSGSIMEAMSWQEHQDSSLPSAQLLTRKYFHYYYHILIYLPYMGMGAPMTPAWPAGHVEMLVMLGRMQSTIEVPLLVPQDTCWRTCQRTVRIAGSSRCLCVQEMALPLPVNLIHMTMPKILPSTQVTTWGVWHWCLQWEKTPTLRKVTLTVCLVFRSRHPPYRHLTVLPC